MKSIDQLVEEHIRESESHLRHIDELMVKASQPSIDTSTDPAVQTLLDQVRESRAQLVQELELLRRGFVNGGDSNMVKSGEGLNSVLQAMGMQLERALTAILDGRGL